MIDFETFNWLWYGIGGLAFGLAFAYFYMLYRGAKKEHESSDNTEKMEK